MIHRHMFWHRNWILVVSAAVVCFVMGAEQAPPRSQTVMQAKLAHTRNLIEALVANDFRALEKEAQEMAAVTREAAWSKAESPAYQAESFEFESTLHLLRELAKAENAKGAALACVTLTLNCVDCHQTMRASGAVELGDITVPAVEELAIEEEPTTSAWMQKKLERTEQVLAGLVSEDFEMLQEAAESMRGLSKVEAWARRLSIPRYDTFMASFDYACEQLEDGAKEKSIDSATLAYTQLLLSCVNCHTELRAQDLPRP